MGEARRMVGDAPLVRGGGGKEQRASARARAGNARAQGAAGEGLPTEGRACGILLQPQSGSHPFTLQQGRRKGTGKMRIRPPAFFPV